MTMPNIADTAPARCCRPALCVVYLACGMSAKWTQLYVLAVSPADAADRAEREYRSTRAGLDHEAAVIEDDLSFKVVKDLGALYEVLYQSSD